MWRWVFVVIVFLLIEIYAFQAFKTLSKSNWIIKSYTIINVIVFVNFFFRLFNIYFQDLDYSDIFYNYLSVPFALLFTLLCFKLIIISFLFFEDIIRIAESTFKFFFSSSSDSFLTQRREFLSKLAILIASVPIPFVIHGIFKGRYNYRVFNYELEFDDLPDDFDGYQLTHISDIHSGSLNNRNNVEYAIDLINKQNSDLILFTGDIVNNKSNELIEWKTLFSKLKAKDGKYSVLGNHDYGDYVQWSSKNEKKLNFQMLLDIQKEMGFNLLLNENTKI
ncbi:MAG: metallophosphoesterase, partial [Flavobacteriaceae bacterium]|nr:metallophosphoesterase [Flavobacteriaceae bacterium]